MWADRVKEALNSVRWLVLRSSASIVEGWWLRLAGFALLFWVAQGPSYSWSVFFLRLLPPLLAGLVVRAACTRHGYRALTIAAIPLLAFLVMLSGVLAAFVWISYGDAPEDDKAYGTAIGVTETWAAVLEGEDGRQVVNEWVEMLELGIGRSILWLPVVFGGAWLGRRCRGVQARPEWLPQIPMPRLRYFVVPGIVLAVVAFEVLGPDLDQDQDVSLPKTLMPAPVATPTPQNKHVGEGKLDSKDIEVWVFEFTNEEREKEGLEPFQHDAAISDIARSHSEHMAEASVFGHSIGGQDANDRAADAGYECRAHREDGSYTYGLGENIALRGRVYLWRGRGSRWWPEEYEVDSRAMARVLVERWMNSPGHRQNILGRQARRIGVGVAVAEEVKFGYINETVYATQNFSNCD